MVLPVTKADLEHRVTQHMRSQIARLRIDQTVGEALEIIRQSPPEGRIVYFYVLDDDGRLRGVLPARTLLLSPSDARLADMMIRRVIAVPETATVLDACEFFIMHRLLAFPVVDAQQHLLGVIDVELYTDELTDLSQETTDDLFQLIGVHLAESQQTSLSAAVRTRFPWLLCNITGGVLAAFLSGVFRDELERVVALALFIPVVLTLAESVSIQSFSLALEAVRGRTPTWSLIGQRLFRELRTGVVLGLASGALVGLVALGWLWHPRLALCIVGGITSAVGSAALIGMAMPNLLHHLRLNPQVSGGPIALATTDVVTLLAYFSLARWLLG